MTKRWSSTKSMDGQTKQQASHAKRREQAFLLREELEDLKRKCVDVVPEDIIPWLID